VADLALAKDVIASSPDLDEKVLGLVLDTVRHIGPGFQFTDSCLASLVEGALMMMMVTLFSLSPFFMQIFA
jgi:hypothetical protein